MATFVDLPYVELVKDAPKVVREGLSGTRMYVLPLPDSTDRAVIVELSASGHIMGAWTIVPGNAYRITPNKVRQMPLTENDPKTVRRFCRINGIAFTRIKYVKRNQIVRFEHPHHQGDTGERWIDTNDDPVVIVSCMTTGNPAHEWLILVVEDEEPKTWLEFCAIAMDWDLVKDGTYKLK